jgi:hypothetical protein
MAILDDFVINTTLQTIRNGGTTVYSVNALYSAIKDFEDDTANMTFETIMTAQTPTEYSIVNGWFIDNESTKYLNGGAITTIGYANEIQRVVTTNAGTDPISTDIGKQVNNGADIGALLHYDLDINNDGTQVNAWYVRTGSTTALSGALTITSGSGSQTVSTSVDGEEIWANIFHLGTIVSNPAPQFYVIQSGERIVEWKNNSNFSRGNLDVLVRVQVEGSLIDSGNLLVTIRQNGDTYDSFEVSAPSGRNPIPLNSATDADNTSPEFYILYDGETSGPFVVGDVIRENGGGWEAEIVSLVDNGTTGILGIRNLNELNGATITDNDAFDTLGGGASAVVNGTKGDRVIAYDAETVAFTTLGQVVTDATGAKGTLRGIQDDGTTGLLLTEVNHDFRADNNYYDLFTEDDLITGSTEGSATVDLATTNLQLAVSGFDDIDIVYHHGSIGVAGGHNLAVGMHVTQAVSGATGTITKVDGNTIYLGNTSADFDNTNAINDDDSASTGTPNSTPAWSDSHTLPLAFQQATNKNYDVVIFMNNRTVSQGYEYGKFVTGDASVFQHNQYNLISSALVRTPVDGQEYLTAYIDQDTPANTYTKTEKRTAPLGNFAGGVWFTARGIWLQDVASADATSYQLIDSDNATQDPPNFVSVIMSNTISGDTVMIAEDDGTGLVKKDTYNSHATNNVAGDTTFDVDGTPTIRTDTPASGYLRVTDDSSTSGQTREHRYKYASFASDTFTLTTFTDSTGTAGSTGLTLVESGRDFTADGVEVGMMVRNTTDGSIGFIATVGTTTLTVKQLEGGTNNDFETGDVVEINKLVTTYVASDTAYTPYIDFNASGTSISATVIFLTNRNLVGKTRNKGVIFAFDGTGTLTDTGGTITTVRTADTIAT